MSEGIDQRDTASRRGHRLRLDDVTHRFGAVVAVSEVAFDVAGGELMALLGPSGCGKSTLLRIVAGFIRQTRGRVLFDEEPVDHLGASRRGVGIVFQNYALFPHMSVARNVAYGLEAHGWPREKVAARVADMLALVHMSEFSERRPRQLSGGQQQRVALARSLAIDPKVLLLDEPFGALDRNLRLDMQIEVKRLQRECGITTILVTHDQEEALSMADRIAVMAHGRIEQISSPTEVYDRPQTLFVNQFVGATNVLAGEFVRVGEDRAVRVPGGVVLGVATRGDFADGARVLVSMRPEHLRFQPAPGDGNMDGCVRAVLPLGPHVVYEIEIAGGASIKLSEPRAAAAPLRQPGERVHVAPASPAACHVFAFGTSPMGDAANESTSRFS